jgi:predicted RNase H-like HicB family nuclease
MERTITLTLEVEREDDRYVSLCPELDVSSYGDSVEDAIAHLKDAVRLYLDTIEADGERERIFQERGIEIEARLTAGYRTTLHPGVLATVARFPIGA